MKKISKTIAALILFLFFTSAIKAGMALAEINNNYPATEVNFWLINGGDAKKVDDYRIGFRPPSAGDSEVSYYLVFLSTKNFESVAQEVFSWEKDYIENELIANNKARKLDKGWADGGANRLISTSGIGATMEVTGEPYQEKKYYVYLATVGNNGVIGLVLAGTIDRQPSSITIEQAVYMVNNARTEEEVKEILEILKGFGWNSLTDNEKNEASRLIYEKKGQGFGSSAEFANAVEFAVAKAKWNTEIERDKWQSAMNAVNNAKNDTEIRNAVENLNPPLWSELTNTGKGTDVPAVLKELKPQGGYDSVDVFADALKKAVALAAINDYAYYKYETEKYIRALRLTDISNFNALPYEKQFIVAGLIEYGVPKHGNSYYYENYSELGPIFETALNSISDKDNQGLGGVFQLNAGEKKILTAPAVIGDDEDIYWFVNNKNVASVDKNSGEVNPMICGKVFIAYAVVDKNTKSEVKNYGCAKFTVIDEINPIGEIPVLEAGLYNRLFIIFNETLSQNTRNINNIADFIEKIEILKGENVETIIPYSSTDSVFWLTETIVKIVFPQPVNIPEGSVLKIYYKDEVKDPSGNKAQPTISSPVCADTTPPIGKVQYPGISKISNIQILFNEKLHEETLEIESASDLLTAVYKVTSSGEKIPVDISLSQVTWQPIGAQDKAIITIPEMDLSFGEYLEIEFNSYRVKDSAGNVISKESTAMPIGGALSDYNDAIYGEMRKAAGGKFPKIAIVPTSRSSFSDAQNSFKGYLPVFVKYGMEPVFIPVAIDNYQNEVSKQDNIDLVNEAFGVFFTGGDQFRHARCLLTDEGKDTPLMTAIREIYASGGLIAGTSAGDHIQSDPMFGGGTSYEDLTANNIKMYPVTQYDYIPEPNQSIMMKGFGFVTQGILDSHFDQRGRIGRLAVALRDSGKAIGIGVDENTAIIIKGNRGRVVGENGVFIIDASNAVFGERSEENNKVPFSVRGLKVTYLTDGDIFDFRTNEIITEKGEINPSGQEYFSNNVFASLENTKLIKSVAESFFSTAYGVTKENDPSFLVIYRKTSDTRAFKADEKYAVYNLEMDIKPNPVRVMGLNISKTSVIITPGQEVNLTANVQPESADIKDVRWESNNSSVASVDKSGKVKALTSGTAVIKAVTVDGGFEAICTVSVISPTASEKEEKENSKPQMKDIDMVKEGGKAKITVNREYIVKNPGDQKVVLLAPQIDESIKEIELVLQKGDFGDLSGKIVKIELPEISIQLSGQDIAYQLKNKDININVKKVELNDLNIILPLGLFNKGDAFEINVGIENLEKKIVLAVKINENINPDLAGLYYYNENTKNFDFKGGKIYEGKIVGTIKPDEAGKYFVMEYKKQFNDVKQGEWYSKYVESMAAKRVVTGYLDGSFKGNSTTSRLEFAVMLCRALGIEKKEYKGVFADIGAENFGAGYIQALYDLGIIKGSEGLFKANDKITREEAFTIIGRALRDVEIDENALQQFNDGSLISRWAKEEVIKAVNAGIIQGSNNKLNPQNKLTRYEAAALMYRLFNR
ncbi:cyanophycinase [Thermovenabulum sp.]|uniref:cyanophycinase n=1 Tax=Thermovenabulum sp. TaxID=3100335 RepID=UPI003C7A616F